MSDEQKILRATGKTLKSALERVFGKDVLPQDALENLANGAINEGVESIGKIVQNPYDCTPAELALKICGAPLVYRSGNNLATGIITHVAPYIEPRDEWTKQKNPGSIAGTAGVWHSLGRGGYDVAIILARNTDLEKISYVALWAAQLSDQTLSMNETAQTFGFPTNVGLGIADGLQQIAIHPYKSSGQSRFGGSYHVERLVETRKGKGCKESYKLTKN